MCILHIVDICLLTYLDTLQIYLEVYTIEIKSLRYSLSMVISHFFPTQKAKEGRYYPLKMSDLTQAIQRFMLHTFIF